MAYAHSEAYKATVTLCIVSCPSMYVSRMWAVGHYSLFITMNLIKNPPLNSTQHHAHARLCTYELL